MRAGVYPRVDAELEKQALNNQAEALQSQLDSIRQRLSELEGGAKPTSA
jgi:prefoldin subunit 5